MQIEQLETLSGEPLHAAPVNDLHEYWSNRRESGHWYEAAVRAGLATEEECNRLQAVLNTHGRGHKVDQADLGRLAEIKALCAAN